MASAALPAHSGAPPTDEAQLQVRNPALLLVGIMAASLLQVLDTTIANVAIPHMQSTLGATSESITWVLTSYIVASAVAMPVTGWLADRVGGRRLFILSVAGFIGASMLCGMAQNLEEMVMFRALQGVAGAFIPALSQSFMLDTSRPSRHPQVMAIWGMGIMIGPILGPILGGWLTESANWRWVFYVNLPVGILALAVLMAELPHRDGAARRFDLTGFALLGLALASFQLLLDRGEHLDWFDAGEIWLYTFLAASAGWMAIVHMATARNPLFEGSMFRDRNFTLALCFMFVIGVVMFANMALLPPMLQHLFGYGVIDTGIVLMPRGVGVLISMQLSGLLIRRGVDARMVVASGFAITALSQWQMAHWSLQADSYHFILSGLIQGLGMGLVFIPLNVTAFSTLEPRLRTEGASLLNLVRSLGASVGISVTTILLARNIQISHEELGGRVTAQSLGALDLSALDRFQALGQAGLAMIDAEVNRQAAMIGYVDDFWLMMWMALAAVPFAFLMRPAKAGAGPAADAVGH
ncbi:DHA2 family efflux MFS transporter permease subunit [Pelagerythrobacter aerophilus]|uniref:DHA2 family efflux MFS transporter permease subunit n=1 Tax=Pelagerythrobacter aerophilus TaxID=2306995 RepID=A0A418NMR8_9SPHN|nr:DHA2 family efflux MFS transporter permease subunit [Pelagerythrobacter aerophilus]RIV81457.1 DHA2 family efflux MFS transporter permease subunit [Pelagerythrobacter aerophilus]